MLVYQRVWEMVLRFPGWKYLSNLSDSTCAGIEQLGSKPSRTWQDFSESKILPKQTIHKTKSACERGNMTYMTNVSPRLSFTYHLPIIYLWFTSHLPTISCNILEPSHSWASWSAPRSCPVVASAPPVVAVQRAAAWVQEGPGNGQGLAGEM